MYVRASYAAPYCSHKVSLGIDRMLRLIYIGCYDLLTVRNREEQK